MPPPNDTTSRIGMPATRWPTITPSDTVAQPAMRSVGLDENGTEGTLVMKDADGNTWTEAMTKGKRVPFSAKLIMTSSTATPLKALS